MKNILVIAPISVADIPSNRKILCEKYMRMIERRESDTPFQIDFWFVDIERIGTIISAETFDDYYIFGFSDQHVEEAIKDTLVDIDFKKVNLYMETPEGIKKVMGIYHVLKLAFEED